MPDGRYDRYVGAVCALLSIAMVAAISLYITAKIYDAAEINVQINVIKKIPQEKGKSE